jgi:hypothetical protein
LEEIKTMASATNHAAMSEFDPDILDEVAIRRRNKREIAINPSYVVAAAAANSDKKGGTKRKASNKKKPSRSSSTKSKAGAPKFKLSRYQHSAGERLKAFALNDRHLYDEEMTKTLGRMVGDDVGTFAMPVTSLSSLLSIAPFDDAMLMALSGMGGDLAKRVVMIVNTVDNEDDENPHWICVLVDHAQRAVLIVDTLDAEEEEDCQDMVVMKLKSFLESTIEPLLEQGVEYDIESRCLGVQRDDFNCGVWALEVAQQFVTDHDFARLTTDYFTSVNIQLRRARLSRQLYG